MAFLDDLWPTILRASQATGLDPRLIAAQATLESGGGQHAPGNNLFGIKGGSGPSLATTEVVNGQPISTTAQFRGYSSPADSVMGYADFINSNKRYGPVKAAQGLDAQIQAMGQSGYATDPNYAQKIGSIAHNLQPPVQISPDAQAFVNNNPQPGGYGPGISDPNAAPVWGASSSPTTPGNAIANWFNGSQKDANAINAVENGENQKSPLQRLATALAKTPNGPQAQSSASLGATNGTALLQYLQNPRQLADLFLQKRLHG